MSMTTSKLFQMKLNDELTICGKSKGGYNTGFYIPELKNLFDAQTKCDFTPLHIFISHCHSDHCWNITQRIGWKDIKPIIYIPHELVELLTDYINSAFRLTYMLKDYILPIDIRGVNEGDNIIINEHVSMNVFNLNHTVPCRGFGLCVDDVTDFSIFDRHNYKNI